MTSLVLAETAKILITAREFKEEEESKITIVSIYFNAGERKWDEYTSVVFNGSAEKMEVGISENDALVLISSPAEKIIKAIELEFEKDSVTNSVVTTLKLTKGSYKNLTAAPDGNSFTFAGGQFGRVEGYERWF